MKAELVYSLLKHFIIIPITLSNTTAVMPIQGKMKYKMIEYISSQIVSDFKIKMLEIHPEFNSNMRENISPEIQ